MLVGRSFETPEEIWRHVCGQLMHGTRRGWSMICLGAIDVCLWDIVGKIRNVPVFRLLGGSSRAKAQTWSGEQSRSVTPYGTVFSRDRDRQTLLSTQLKMVERLCEAGFQAVKIEPVESSPDTVVELAKEARRLAGSDVAIAVDVGYLWTDVVVAARTARAIEPFDVAFLETPFSTDALPAYADLTGRTTIPLAAGEHSIGRAEFVELIDEGRCSVVQPYVTTAGGFTELKRIVEYCAPRGIALYPGNWSTQVLGACSIHLAAYSGISPLLEFVAADIFGSPLRAAIEAHAHPVRNGRIAVPEKPGLGIELPTDLIEHFRVG
jgi:L-alanine-DL-glutamate epimerase-like enolase superfamily enzyme